MQRKLASIQRVLEIIPIEGADAIEAVRINGWQCVVKKNAFSVGDRGVFFEIDAIPPDLPAFRFLWASKGDTPTEGSRPANFRIRTRKMRGCMSQGLFISLGETGLPEDVVEGEDVTERLGVTKYDPPLPTGSPRMGLTRGSFPRAVPRTDEERVQSAPAVLDELRGHPYVATLKCDGTSSTYLINPDDGTFHACGRNWSITDGDNLYWNIAHRYNLEEGLRRLGGNLAIQGEICGPGIQKNPLGLRENDFFLFSVYNMVTRRHLSDPELREVALQLGVKPVPIVEAGDSFNHTTASLLSLAEGKYEGTKNEREGIVIRPLTPMYSPTLQGHLSFKAISNRYLLNEKD